MKETYDKLGSLSPKQLQWLDDRIKDKTIEVPAETVLPEGTRVFVVGRAPRHVWCYEYWHGLAVDAGPSMLSLALFSDHSVENAGLPNYPGYDGMRWYLTREEAEEAAGKLEAGK
jgi:hypothetical protein